ncbi:MAG TPA: MGMT family protein [Chloroflexota bacterium]
MPCHRVVRSDGSIGQYVGGMTAIKTRTKPILGRCPV